MIKPSSKIFIQKAPKKKDAVRINSAEDIPEFLRNTISIDGDEMVMHNAEGGEQRAPLGMVCGFEKSEKTSSGYGMWPISDESRIIEKDGVFYAKPKVTPACPMGVEIPDWLEGAPIKKNPDDSFTITTSWGKSTGQMMDSYWVRYGTKEDGTPDANILTKSEQSFDDYYLCTEDGQNICPLREFDEGFEYELDSNLRLTPEEYAAQLAEENGIQLSAKISPVFPPPSIAGCVQAMAVKEGKQLAMVRTSFSEDGVGYVKYNKSLLSYKYGDDTAICPVSSENNTVVCKVIENGQPVFKSFDYDTFMKDVWQANKDAQSSREQKAGEIVPSLSDCDFGNDGFGDDQLS